MAKFPLDLSKFKKVQEDQHKTTLRHEDGHMIILSNKKLEPKIRGKLAQLKMANGGKMADEADRLAMSQPEDEEASPPASESQRMEVKESDKPLPSDQMPKELMANGGKVPKVQNEEMSEDSTPAPIPNNAPDEQMSDEEQVSTASPSSAVTQPSPSVVTSDDPSKALETAVTQKAAGLVPQANLASATPPQPPTAGIQQGIDQQENMVNDALNNQLSGARKAGQAQAQLGLAQADILKRQAETQQQALNHFNKQYNDLDSERQSLQHDVMNGHIDPNHLWNNASTGQKVGTAIGLILGGIGSGLTGRENPALQFLNNQIDRDIDAQKQELGKKENLLSANMRQFGNLKDATEMTKLMQADLITNKLNMAAAQAQDPMSKARAQQAVGQIQQAMAPMMQSFALRRAMIDYAEKNPNDKDTTGHMLNYMRVVNPEQAKEMESRYLPGVGMASVPLSQEVRGNITAKQTLNNMARDFYGWAQKHSGSISPSDINIGKTKAAELQSLYRNAINGGVFKKGEQEFIDQIVDSDPTKFFNNIRVLPKLKEVIDSNDAQLNQLKKSNGLPSSRPEDNLNDQQKGFLQWARQNPNNPKAKMVLKKLGI